MPEFAPLFTENASVLPKNTQPLTNLLVRNGLVSTAVGAAAGVSTVVNKSRVKHPAGFREFMPTIEAEALINRNSAAADITQMKKVFTKKKASFGFVRDLSGNGGPAFTRS